MVTTAQTTPQNGTGQAAASGATKANNSGAVTNVPATPKRTVTYVLKSTTTANLSMPYAVAVNGKALAAYDKKPARVSGSGGKIVVSVDAGSKVALYLNSDAHPSYRTQPVYEVTPTDRDVIVRITEKEGKHSDKDTPVLKAAPAPAPATPAPNSATTAAPSAGAGKAPAQLKAAVPVDEYTAPLTGDIWMKISHKYTAAEVDALVPAGTSAEVAAAIKSIYNGLKSQTLKFALTPTAGNAARSLEVTFSDSNDPKDNIVSYGLLTDGLTRVHPAGYAALFSSAIENSVAELKVTSCWRPTLGSIAHRAGLGLDVNYVGKTRMNRQELRNAFLGKIPSKQGDGDDSDNVSDAEVEKFAEYESAIAAKTKADSELVAARKALDAAKKSKDAAKIAQAQAQEKSAVQAADDTAREQRDALKAWNDERDAAEPSGVREFRASLLKCSCVRQLFDPWFMDENTRDKTDPSPNMQRGSSTSNERLHAHHLHITVHEPNIL